MRGLAELAPTHCLPLSLSLHSGDEDLSSTAIQHFILAPYSYGWDKENGGLFYFLDCDGRPPVQLEWAMKLWWVHCEALVALLMAFRASGDHALWSQFIQLTEYTFSKVGREGKVLVVTLN